MNKLIMDISAKMANRITVSEKSLSYCLLSEEWEKRIAEVVSVGHSVPMSFGENTAFCRSFLKSEIGVVRTGFSMYDSLVSTGLLFIPKHLIFKTSKEHHWEVQIRCLAKVKYVSPLHAYQKNYFFVAEKVVRPLTDQKVYSLESVEKYLSGSNIL